MKKLWVLFTFSIAFGFVEAAVVVYLRKIFGLGFEYSVGNYAITLNLGLIAFLSPKTAIFPDSVISHIEVMREIATLFMLGSVSFIAGKNLKSKLAALCITFSLWDLFYYVFLKVLIGWPKGLLDIDIFFLNPVPWVGPVLTPIVISSTLLLIGVWIFTKSES